MFNDFQAVLIEGVFHLDGDRLLADAQDVTDRLNPLVGRRVQLAAHHLPPMPPNPTAWGGGCCFWQGAGRCPFGHHDQPTRLFSVVAEGVLVHEGHWFVEQFDGNRVILGLEEALPGHQGRIAAATALTVEQMREAAAQSLGNAAGTRAADLSSMLERLRRGTN